MIHVYHLYTENVRTNLWLIQTNLAAFCFGDRVGIEGLDVDGGRFALHGIPHARGSKVSTDSTQKGNYLHYMLAGHNTPGWI